MRKAIFLLGVLVGTSWLLPAQAQTQAPAENQAQGATADEELQTVIVTAQKRPEDLQKTAISIQVVNGEDLKKDSKKRLDEIMNGVVGVNVQGSQVGDSFYMRGVEAGGGGAPGGGPNQSTVAILIDGVYQDRGEVVRGGSVDLSQVEVMRGTQSTSLGASALAGAVSLVSNQPTFQYSGTGSVDIGNFDLRNLEGVINLPLADNQAIRLAYSTQQRDGYEASDAGNSQLTTVRGKYRWKITDDIDTVFTASSNYIGGNGVSDGVLAYSGRWEDCSQLNNCAGVLVANTTCGVGGGPPGAPTPAGGIITVMGCPFQEALVNTGQAWYQRSNPWDDGFRQSMWPNQPYRHTTVDNYSEQVTWNTAIGTVTLEPSLQHSTFLSNEPPRGESWMDQDQVQKGSQFDGRIVSPTTSAIQWQAGVNYYHTDLSGSFEDINAPGNGMGPPCTGGPPVDNTAYCYGWNWGEGVQTTEAAYANLTYPIVPTVRAVAGLRYTHDKKSYSEDINAFNSAGGDVLGTAFGPSSPYFADGTAAGSANWEDLNYSLGLEYDVAPQAMVYVKYQTGYQPGSIQAATTTTSAVTDKQTLTQWTLGIKSRWFDNKLQFNAEVFHSIYDNQPLAGGLPAAATSASACNGVGGPPGSGPTLVAQIDANGGCFDDTGTVTFPRSLSEGVDLEVNLVPSSHDRLDVTYEWLKSQYNSNPSAPAESAASILALCDSENATPGNATPCTSFAGSAAIAAQLASTFNANAQGYSGFLLQNSPKQSLNVTYRHRFDLPNGSTVTPRVQGAYKSAYWTEGGGPTFITITQINQDFTHGVLDPAIQGGYTLWDAYLAWENPTGKLTAQAYVHNIADKAIEQNYGGTYVTLGAPRTYGISFNASF